MMKISKYISPELIVFLSAENRDEVIRRLVDVLDKAGKLIDKETFFTSIMEREKIVTTGIGMGVAIPHAKLPGYNDFFMSIGILNKGIDWGALDGTLVRLVFIIGGPDDKQTEYLQILSGLTMALKDEDRRKKLLLSTSPQEVINIFKGF